MAGNKRIILSEESKRLGAWNHLCRILKPQTRSRCFTCDQNLYMDGSCPLMCVETEKPDYLKNAAEELPEKIADEVGIYGEERSFFVSALKKKLDI